MITEKKASEKHFDLHNKIKEVIPRKDGSGDINKCISLCEEGMENLKFFIKENNTNAFHTHQYLKEIKIEEEFAAPFPPLSILCRDVLIDCYLMTDKFSLAKNVVERALMAKAWNEEQVNEQLEYIDKVEDSRNLLYERIRESPGTLQKEIYAILPDADKKAMQWYLANSKTIYKLKTKSSYSIWMSKDDVSEKDLNSSVERAITENKLNKEKADLANELLLQNKLSTSFPAWYISISFGHSRSKNYTKAVNLAKSAPQYIESYDSDNNIIHQAVYSDKRTDYLNFISLYEIINNWKSCFVNINGDIVDRKIVGGLNYCYGDKLRIGKSDFCYGASEFTKNPFGCHRLQISSFNHPWWSFGNFNANGIWLINKTAILNRIKEYSQPYIHCPAFSMEEILNVVDKLPNFIDPERNQHWIKTADGVEPKDDRSAKAISIQLGKPLNIEG